MSARFVLRKAARYVFRFERGVQETAVFEFDDGIVAAGEDVCRRHCRRDLLFHGKAFFSFFAHIFSEQAFPRPLVCDIVAHRNDGVDRHNAVGTQAYFYIDTEFCKFVAAFGKSARHRYQVSACGKTDCADSGGIDAVVVRVFAHELDRALYVFELSGVMRAALGNSVAQHESRNAERVESLCSAVPFVIHPQVVIASAGTNDERASVCVFGLAHKHNRIAVFHAPHAPPQKNGAAGSGEGKGGKDNKKNRTYRTSAAHICFDNFFTACKEAQCRYMETMQAFDFFIHGKNLPEYDPSVNEQK